MHVESMVRSILPVSKTFSTDPLVLKMRHMLSAVSLRFVKYQIPGFFREFRPYRKIGDNYRKTVLTLTVPDRDLTRG